MNIDKSGILIILPAYNEAQVIENVLLDLKNHGYSNICLVDDGSTDGTSQIAKSHQIKILKHPINLGAGAAIQTGINYARNQNFQFAILIDSDGQHFPEDIESLYDAMQKSEADIVIGNRFSNLENEIPTQRLRYNRIANRLTNFFCDHTYSDTQSGFRLLNRRAIEKLNLKNSGFGFCSEMIIEGEKLNLKIVETPIRVLYTEYSLKKGQDFREGVRTARSIIWQVLFD